MKAQKVSNEIMKKRFEKFESSINSRDFKKFFLIK